jgi:antitoxin VapB
MALIHSAVKALRDRLVGAEGDDESGRVREELRAIRARMERYPVLDDRSPDEILGYDENGIPH